MRAQITIQPKKFYKAQNYQIVLTTKEKIWEVNHSFSRFKNLHDVITLAHPLFISSEFPQNKQRMTLLSSKSSLQYAQEQKDRLELWLNEVLANLSVFPEKSTRMEVLNFVGAPEKIDLISTSAVNCPSLPVSENFASLQLQLNSSNYGTRVGGFSRLDKVIEPLRKPLWKEILLFFREKFSLVVLFAFLHVALDHYLTARGLISASCQLFVVSVAVFCGQIFLEGSRKKESEQSCIPSYLRIQYYLRTFLQDNTIVCKDLHPRITSLTRNPNRNKPGLKSKLRSFDSDIDEDLLLELDESEENVVRLSRAPGSRISSPSITLTPHVRASPESPPRFFNSSSTNEYDSKYSKLQPRGTKIEEEHPTAGRVGEEVLTKRHMQFVESGFDNSLSSILMEQSITAKIKMFFEDKGDCHAFNVRGLTYMDDQVKVHPGAAMCKFVLLETYEVEAKDGERHDHIVKRGLAKQRLNAFRSLPGNPFVFVVNFQLPGNPPISMVAYFLLPPDLKQKFPGKEIETDKFLSLFRKFVSIPPDEAARIQAWNNSSSASEVAKEDGPVSTRDSGSSWGLPSRVNWPHKSDRGTLPPDDFRNLRFKIFPIVTEGPWIVRAAVRPRPAILGQKIVQRYFAGDGYFELDANVGSSVVANQIIGVCRGYCKHFTTDIAIILQGESERELPEKLLACASLVRIDLDVRQKLD